MKVPDHRDGLDVSMPRAVAIRGTALRADLAVAVAVSAAAAGVSGALVWIGAPPWIAVPVIAAALGLLAWRKVGGVKGLIVRRALGSAFIDDVDGRVITGRDGTILYMNAAFRKLAGGGNLATAVGGDEESVARLARMGARAVGAATSREDFAVPLPGGGRRWLGIVAFPLPGVPGAVAWTAADVTAQREVGHAAREELSRLADFFDHAPTGLFSVDAQGRFRLVNDVLARWLEQDPVRMVDDGRRLAEFVAPSEVPGADPSRGERANQGLPTSWSGSWEGEVRLVAPSGASRPVYISQELALDRDGQPTYTRGLARDLSEERALQERLRRTQEALLRFFDVAPVGIVMVDASGDVVETNPAFRAMTGASEDNVRSFFDFIVKDDRERVKNRMARARAGEPDPLPLEVRLAGQAPRITQLHVRGPGEGDEGDLLVYIVDQTEQKNLELQFAQSQKMQAVGQLAGGIAHDFNNLLTAIIGYSDLLLQHHQPGDRSFADIMQIKQNANRAANLVRQLLAFSRRQTLNPSTLDLTDVLAELANLVRRLIGEKIELKMVHGRDLWPVRVDQGQLEQVIVNLAVNARDAMGEGGSLMVRTANASLSEETRKAGFETMPPGEYVLIEVSDSGVGIPEENLVKIFEPFFTTKRVGQGTGLGLSTVYGIIKQTGGFIFPSSQVGKGATFRIYLPRHDAPPEAMQKPGADPRLTRDLTGQGVVLLVEDEAPVRRFAARALENKGYTVMQAESAEEALAMIQQHTGKIDLVITDVVMPGMDGPTLVAEARKKRPGVRVIFISGYAEEVFAHSLDPTTKFTFLPKPFSLKELAGRVKEVMSEGE